MRIQPRSARSLCLGRYTLQPPPSKRGRSPRSIQGYQRAGLVTPEELALIKKVDRQTRPKIESLHASDGQTYALLYLRLLKKVQRIDTQSFILVLIADALTGMSLRAIKSRCDYSPPFRS